MLWPLDQDHEHLPATSQQQVLITTDLAHTGIGDLEVKGFGDPLQKAWIVLSLFLGTRLFLPKGK